MVELLFVVFAIFVGVVIPILMRSKLTARGALRLLPAIATTWTHACSPERVPQGAATEHAFPLIVVLWRYVQCGQ